MKNKKIIIIGGTGALGKTLIKKYHKDNTIMIFSRDEHKHVNLLKKYPKNSVGWHLNKMQLDPKYADFDFLQSKKYTNPQQAF